MPLIAPHLLLSTLVWVVVGLMAQMALLLLTGAWIQVRRDRFAKFRVSCHQRWEEDIVAYLYRGESGLRLFGNLNLREKRLLIPFLVRVLAIFSGREGEAVRELYGELRLARGLAERLRSRFAKIRGLAALEVGHFRVDAHYPVLRELLEDPVPHVAHAAARSLASTQDLRFAEPVMGWMLTQEVFQRDRMLWILESFGPSLLPWMEDRMDAVSGPDPLFQELYALLAGSFRSGRTQPRVLELLRSGTLGVQAAALRALGSLGDPEAFPEVLPFVEHEEWVLRGQLAKILGVLGGPAAIPQLTHLMGDPVFDVRRNAAYSLSQLGHAGTTALEWVSGDPTADPFARDLALERLQWAHQRGR